MNNPTPTPADKQLFLDARDAYNAALYQKGGTDGGALAAAATIIAANQSALHDRIAKLERQLEHEYAFDVANNTFADDAPEWPKHEEIDGEQVFERLAAEDGAPRESAVRLSRFIPLEHQMIFVTRRNLTKLVQWVRELRGKMAAPKP